MEGDRDGAPELEGRREVPRDEGGERPIEGEREGILRQIK